jgi:hypothetical protein
MDMRQSRGSVIAAIAVFFIATVFQFAALPPADAHGGGFVTTGGHHINTPPPVTPAPANNVRNFGAVGDGTTDDSTAIQNAANDAANRHIGVFFPAGTYLHFSPLFFNGVAVSGVGSTSVLISNNPTNCAVFLTGSGPSIQKMVISTQGIEADSDQNDPQLSTLAIFNATSWTVAHCTIVQGTNTWGVFAFQSTVGAITANVFDGTGNANDVAIVANICTNITASSNLTQNEAVGFTAQGSLFIAVLSNTFGNVTFPTLQFAIEPISVINCTIAQNTIQMANSNGGTAAIATFFCDNTFVQSNDTWGGFDGIIVYGAGSGTNVVSQNTIHNTGLQGITAANEANSAVQIMSNTFGECGLLATQPDPFFINAVILVEGLSPPSSDASGATTIVQNNSYQGHVNGLSTLVTSTFTAPHIPAANVTGNTPTQTALGNHI